jgi:two-component sensor histidine kinase
MEQRLAAFDGQARVDAQMRAQEESLRQTRQNLFAIYNASAEGLALCRAVKGENGEVIDYHVLEVNDAHRALTGATRAQMLGSPVSQIAPPVNPLWFSSADSAIKTGKMQHFDVRSPVTGRWLNIRVSPVSEDLFQQTFVDVSDRHLLDDQRQHLLKEMSHRIANNLQMMASFLHIQAGLAEDSAKTHLQTAEARVQVLSKLHSLLAYTESDREIDAADYIADLCDHLRTLVDRPGDIKIEHDCQALLLSAEKMVPIGFIISELVTNAAKYAFPNKTGGVIKVRLAPEEGRWALSIADDGQGLQEKPKATRGGLGTRLVQAFVSQIGGALTTTSNPGLRHVISFVP